MYIYMYIYIYTYVYLHVYFHIYVHMHVNIIMVRLLISSMCMYVYIHICIYICMCICICLYVYTCVYLYVSCCNILQYSATRFNALQHTLFSPTFSGCCKGSSTYRGQDEFHMKESSRVTHFFSFSNFLRILQRVRGSYGGGENFKWNNFLTIFFLFSPSLPQDAAKGEVPTEEEVNFVMRTTHQKTSGQGKGISMSEMKVRVFPFPLPAPEAGGCFFWEFCIAYKAPQNFWARQGNFHERNAVVFISVFSFPTLTRSTL